MAMSISLSRVEPVSIKLANLSRGCTPAEMLFAFCFHPIFRLNSIPKKFFPLAVGILALIDIATCSLNTRVLIFVIRCHPHACQFQAKGVGPTHLYAVALNSNLEHFDMYIAAWKLGDSGNDLSSSSKLLERDLWHYVYF